MWVQLQFKKKIVDALLVISIELYFTESISMNLSEILTKVKLLLNQRTCENMWLFILFGTLLKNVYVTPLRKRYASYNPVEWLRKG